MPELSIIIPTLNEEDFLPLLLSSIQKQTYKNYEVIVADAGSTDGTVEIAKQFGCKITSGGLPATGRNRGAEASGGELFLFLDSDVMLPKNFLANTINEFRKRKLDIATCGVYPLSDKKIDKFLHLAVNSFFKTVQFFSPHAPGFCILIKNDIHKNIGGFNEQILLAEDHDYVKRAAKVGNFRFLQSEKIPVSVRRLDRDGRAKIALKYIL
ncbi:MAG: glycosyltransferase, partial [Patescibacteria group bacterium]|nr:glycosyltransferase [Patescibacteria group bacterium]